MLDVLYDAIFDSFVTFVIVLIVYIGFSFVEMKITTKIQKGNKLSPLFGALVGLVPQCGVSVVGADLYLKNHITVGTLMAIFIACSDEAIPVILAGGGNAYMVVPLVLSKIVIGFIVGFLADKIVSKRHVEQHLEHCKHDDLEVHTGCCNHSIDDERDDWFDKHILHPFIHSIKLCAYVVVINLSLAILFYFIGWFAIGEFLINSKYLSVICSVLVGLIPNCASSVILAQLFIKGVLPFGAALAGLCVNAGLGMVMLFKDKKNMKRNVLILLTLCIVAMVVGYITCFILGF